MSIWGMHSLFQCSVIRICKMMRHMNEYPQKVKNDVTLSTDLHPAVGVGWCGGDLLGGRGLDGDLALRHRSRDHALRKIIHLEVSPPRKCVK